MSTERIVIVGYRPLPGKEKQLHELMKTHVDILRKEGLASNRQSIMMTTSDGTVIEVFGWKSKEAIQSAHSNAAVQKMWGEYAEVCEYVPVGNISEIRNLFSEFTPL
ncbi:MAG TPA: hypothetical protein VGK59_17460 [Ohtaekwangia sp.]